MPIPQIPLRSNMDMSQSYADRALGARSAMRPGSTTEYNKADPTLGGAISAGFGGAAAGAEVGALVGSSMSTAATAAGATVAEAAAAGSSAGPWGAAIGAVAGMLAYALG